jgi:adenylate kinase
MHDIDKTLLEGRLFSFFGLPGAGKGTLARRCRAELGMTILSTGDMLRQEVAKESSLGVQIKDVIAAGKLVDGNLITKLAFNWFDELDDANTVIFDGYPRTVEQAELMVGELVKRGKKKFFSVVFFDLDRAEVTGRLTSRRVCSNRDCQAIYSLIGKKPAQEGICDECQSELVQRPDDQLDIIEQRFVEYDKVAHELLEYYENVGFEVHCLDLTHKDEKQVFDIFVDFVLNTPSV